MFNLFASKKTEQQIIAEIHNEFDSAEDRLLKEADSLLSELSITTEQAYESKAERLARLGFTSAEVVVRTNGLKAIREKEKIKIVSTKIEAETIRYYKKNYPFQKFLTENELQRICNKYKLIYAPVKNYMKDVPEKNIDEIENSSPLKKEDALGVEYYYKCTDSKNIKKDCPERVKEALLNGIKIDGTSAYYLEDALRNQFNIKDEYSILERPRDKHDLICMDKKGLFIAAPASHFNLKGLSKENKFSFLEMSVTKVDDPIVFRYCRGGIQVLSKWGLEGEDESLVNEKLN